jgi:hypothetical protein
LIGYLEYQRWITVNWTILENQTSTVMTHAANKAYIITQQMGHCIPVGLGGYGIHTWTDNRDDQRLDRNSGAVGLLD